MMKVTLTRKNKKMDTHRVATLADLLEELKNQKKSGLVALVRHNIRLLHGQGRPIGLDQLPWINFAAEYRRRRGITTFVRYNGWVLVTFEKLSGPKEAAGVRDMLARLPHTLLAFTGLSGTTVKFLLFFQRYDGSLPQTEKEAILFQAHAYAWAVKYCRAQFPSLHIRMQKPSLQQGCRFTYDPNLYYNPFAQSIRMDQPLEMPSEKTHREARAEDPLPLNRVAPGYDRQRLISLLYETSFKKAFTESGYSRGKRIKELLQLLATYCHGSGIPEEEAVTWTVFRFQDEIPEPEIRETFRNLYLHRSRFGEKPAIPVKQSLYYQMEEFINRRYEFRHNTMKGVPEYRERKSYFFDFREVDERVLNSISIQAMAEGIDIWDKDVKRWLYSDKVPVYSPVEEYLWQLPSWDGKERIKGYAARVPVDNPEWELFFYRWFLSMVAHWAGLDRKYANSTSPLLVGAQGGGKSTFCRNILPPELKEYYTDRIDFGMKRDAELALNRFALINMDEFDQITPREQTFLKHILQKPVVNTRRPHKSVIREMRRYASFIATSNHQDLLTDTSGSRRFIGVYVSGPVDNVTPVDYRQLYAEAFYKIKNRERYWFTPAEEEVLIRNNRAFEQLSPVEQLFVRYYRPALSGERCRKMMAVEILEALRKKSGIQLSDMKIITFGRILRKLNIPVKKEQDGNYYLVVEKRYHLKDEKDDE